MMWDLSAVVLRFEELELDKGRAGEDFFSFVHSNKFSHMLHPMVHEITDDNDLYFRGIKILIQENTSLYSISSNYIS